MEEGGDQRLVRMEVVEVQVVRPEHVRVAAEHLLVHVLALGREALWEAGQLAWPVVRVICHLGEHSRGWEWWCGCEVVRWEQRLVLDLAEDPDLDVRHVLGGGEVDWVLLSVDPGVDHPSQWVSGAVIA